MILDTLPNLARYAALHPLFPEAVRFLMQPNLAALPDGRVELLDNKRMFASIAACETEPFDAGLLEGHQTYIDIQVILEGRETLGWAALENQPVATPYDPARDIAFFHGPSRPIRFHAGEFLILWPSDLHLPQRHFANTAERVRKTVLKIKV